MEKINFKNVFISFITIFVLTFVVSAFTTFLYSLIVHKSGSVDWATSVRLGIILGIVLTWVNTKGKS